MDDIHTFLTTQGHGGPSRMRADLNAGASSETTGTWKTIHPFSLSRWIWKHNYDGQMMFGKLMGLKLPDICLTDEEKLRKNSPRKLVPTGDRIRVRCVTGAHATACSTAVDDNYILLKLNYICTYNCWYSILYPGNLSQLQFYNIMNHVTDINTSHLMKYCISCLHFVKECPRD